MAMGKHHPHLRVISTAPMALLGASVRAPDQHLPPPVSADTCRDLLGAFASMLLLLPIEAGASKAAELDGELLACCCEAQAIDVRSNAICDEVEDLPSSDPRWEMAYTEAAILMKNYRVAVARAVVLPARTPEGLRAKAGLVLSHMQNDDTSTDIALSLARDVTGRA